MRLNAILLGLTLSLAAGVAMACPSPDRCGGDRYGPSAYERYDDDARYAPPAYDEGYADDRGYDDGYDDERYEDRYGADDYRDAPGAWNDQRGLYIRGHRGESCGCRPPPTSCGCDAGLTLSSSFFDGSGGVGPIPDGGYYGGGGYYFVGGGSGASSHAFASASARASASVSVRYRGGYGYRPPGGHGGHKGGGKHH
jgi:hypothetical protein